MPSYKNRRPMCPDTQVWHYTDLEAVVAIWRGKQLRLTRLDKFSDPFEGSVPKQDIDNQVPLFAGSQGLTMRMQHSAARHSVMPTSNRDLWGEMTKRRRAKTRSAHAICWSSGDESEAMWNLYCKDGKRGQGLALRSTLAILEESVVHENVYVSPLNYRFYHEGPAFNDELDAFMNKRKGFEYEQEVRVVMYDAAHWSMLSRFLIENPTKAPKRGLAKYKYLDWSPTTCVEAITISPFASEAYESTVRRTILNLDPEVPVELSVLSERLYAPQF